MDSKDSKIGIIGGGVFGLSTSLFLAKAGYTDITVYDKNAFEKSYYDPAFGCEGASADYNKVFRASYGNDELSQSLAYEAKAVFEEWNQAIAGATSGDLPDGLTRDDIIFDRCGFTRFGKELSAFDHASLAKFEKEVPESLKEDRERVESYEASDPTKNWKYKMGVFNSDAEQLDGYLDTGAGYIVADKACIYAAHLCRQAGVKFVLDPTKGKLVELIKDGSTVKGIKMADGVIHEHDLVIVAAGGWTPSIVPEASELLETTMGSVIHIQLPPQEERPDLWDRYSPEKFSVFTFERTATYATGGDEYSGIGGFPRTKSGKIKMGYRGRKWTNYPDSAKPAISTPITAYSEPAIDNLPLGAVNHFKRFIKAYMPDLADVGITGTRACWYTDSIDNQFVIDYVPGTNKSLFLCTGGSGHGFKFLPVLGSKVVPILRGEKDAFSETYKWRSPKEGAGRNGLEDGPAGPRNLERLVLATKEDWKF